MTTTEELDARRQAIGDAALGILASHGVTELSVRNVATATNIAPSSLRYLFPSQHHLRVHVAELLIERLRARVATHRSAHEPTTADERWAVLCELLPLDAVRTLEMEATIALGTAAHTDTELQPAYIRLHETVREVCETALTIDGAPPTALDITRTHALVDGIALHLIRPFSGLDVDHALAALRSNCDAHPTVQKRNPK